MEFKIRPYHPSDLCALYRICLLTGDNGKDATAQYRDPELLGHYYAGPYGVYEPDLCFVLTADGDPCGYILGARDSRAFGERLEQEWFPTLRERYPMPADEDDSPDAHMIRAIHRGYSISPEAEAYPAHLHIDLLPVAQHQGMGSKMMRAFLDRLRELHIPAVHLGVGIENRHAVAFYARAGFHIIQQYPWGILYGMFLEQGGRE
jgi:ribosomal protein S18 acetylase RimI-like enzyme